MTLFARFYLGLIAFGNALQSLLLLLIRLFWGGLFFRAGFGKLLTIDSVIGFFQTLNIPAPAFSAYLTAIIECFGGALLFIGLGSRLVAIPLIIIMIVAFLSAYPDSLQLLFSKPTALTMREPFAFFFACMIILIFGPGKYSVDQLIERRYF